MRTVLEVLVPCVLGFLMKLKEGRIAVFLGHRLHDQGSRHEDALSHVARACCKGSIICAFVILPDWLIG
jgi:hypothetical protein